MDIKAHPNYWNTRRFEVFQPIIADILGRNLERNGIKTVYISGGSLSYYKVQRNPDEFHIFIGGTSYGGEIRSKAGALDTMWGVSTGFGGCDCGTLLEASGNGLLVIEPQSNYPVAELIGNNLFILFNIANTNHLGDEARTAIFQNILNEALVLLGGNFPSLESLYNGKYKMPVLRAAGIVQKELADARRELAKLVSYGMELQSKLESLEGQGSPSDQILNRIASIPEIKSVDVSGKSMVLITHAMYGFDREREKIHEYGNFKLTLDFGQGANVKFTNLTRRPYEDYYGTYGHPHVDRARGYWCQGEGEGILALLQSFEYEAAILFALKAIDSVNTDPRGNYVEVLRKFPIVTERKPYPTEREPIDPDTRRAFARIFGNDGRQTEDMRAQIALNRQSVRKFQQRIITGRMEQTLARMISVTGNRGDKAHKAMKSLSAHIGSALSATSGIESVSSVYPKGDALTIRTKDSVLGANRALAPDGYEIVFDFSSGVTSARAIGMPDPETVPPKNGVPDGPKGELPLGQLTSTIPDLLGAFEIETATTMVIEHLIQQAEEAAETETVAEQRAA